MDGLIFKNKNYAKEWRVHNYNSLPELMRYLDKNKDTETNHRQSDARSISRSDWAKSNSLAEAVKKLKTGDTEILAGLKKAVKLEVQKLAKELNTLPEGYIADVTGLFFDVAKVIEGEPEAWYREPWDKTKKPRLSIPIMGNYSAGFNANTAIKNAAEIIALIKALEDNGFEIELIMTFAAEHMNNGIGERHGMSVVKVKGFEENFNWKKLSTILHPSFFRRIIFRDRELLFPKTLGSSYGDTPNPAKWWENGESMLQIGEHSTIEKFKEQVLYRLKGNKK